MVVKVEYAWEGLASGIAEAMQRVELRVAETIRRYFKYAIAADMIETNAW